MSRTLLPLVFLLLAAGGFLCHADEPNLQTVSPEVLITQLGSREFAKREQAAKELQARGPAVLPVLRQAATHKDAEVRRRVAELIPLLEAAEILAPRRVTLTGEKRPLSAILKDIEKQTGYTVEEVERNDSPRFTAEMHDVPFWEALERVRREAGCIVVSRNSPEKLEFMKSKAQRPFVVAAEAFRLELMRLHEDRDLDFERAGLGNEVAARRRLLTAHFALSAEPKFFVLDSLTPTIDSAVDEHGKAFTILCAEPKKAFDDSLAGQSRNANRFALSLQGATADSRQLKELRGTLPIQVAVRRKTVVATEKFLQSKGTTFRVGDETLTIAQIRQMDRLYQLRIEVPRPLGYTPCWHQRIHLEDANGNRYQCDYAGSSNGAPNMPCWINFDFWAEVNIAAGPPVKLVVDEWTVVQHSVQFVFKDVPLP